MAAAPSSPDTPRMPPSPCCFSYMGRGSHPRRLWPAHRTGGCTLWCLPRRSFGVVTTIRMEWREVLEVRFRSSGGRSLPRPERLLSEDAERAAGYEVALKVEVIVDGFRSAELIPAILKRCILRSGAEPAYANSWRDCYDVALVHGEPSISIRPLPHHRNVACRSPALRAQSTASS